MSIHMKIYEQGVETLLAACDESLLGQVYTEGEIHLDVKESFYGGDIVKSVSLKEKMREATIINLVGSDCVDVAIDMGLGSEGDVMEVQGVPHLQIVRM